MCMRAPVRCVFIQMLNACIIIFVSGAVRHHRRIVERPPYSMTTVLTRTCTLQHPIRLNGRIATVVQCTYSDRNRSPYIDRSTLMITRLAGCSYDRAEKSQTLR